jgi:hypothetical protein
MNAKRGIIIAIVGTAYTLKSVRAKRAKGISFRDLK